MKTKKTKQSKKISAPDAQKHGVSVIIPVFNAAPYIEATLKSVFAQSYPIREIIVVDDGSSDHTATVVRKVDPKIRVIRQENKGVSYARNKGALAAKSEYIAFLDADDAWDKDKIKKQMQVCIAHPEVDLCFTDYSVENMDGSTVRSYFTSAGIIDGLQDSIHDGGLLNKKEFYYHSLKRGIVMSQSVVMKRSVFVESKGFDEQLALAEDMDLWIRIARNYQCAGVLEPLFSYIHTKDSLSTHKKEMYAYSLVVLEKSLALAKIDLVPSSTLQVLITRIDKYYYSVASCYIQDGMFVQGWMKLFESHHVFSLHFVHNTMKLGYKTLKRVFL